MFLRRDAALARIVAVTPQLRMESVGKPWVCEGTHGKALARGV